MLSNPEQLGHSGSLRRGAGEYHVECGPVPPVVTVTRLVWDLQQGPGKDRRVRGKDGPVDNGKSRHLQRFQMPGLKWRYREFR